MKKVTSIIAMVVLFTTAIQANKMTIKQRGFVDSYALSSYSLSSFDSVMLFDTIVMEVSPPNGKYDTSVFIHPSKPSTDESISSTLEVRDGIVVVVFILVIIFLLYGIIHRNSPIETDQQKETNN